MDFTVKTEKDFFKARHKALFNEIQHFLNPEEAHMIPLNELRQYIKPQNETYIGMKTIPLANIIGSEGRYKDFDNQFFPKNTFMRERWEHVDEAVLREIILPPIKVYELGGLYFVRDGNHRVSVAKSQGVEFIDAEIVSLQTEIKLMPVRTLQGMYKQIIRWEKGNFYFETNFGDITDYWCLDFSSPGQYDVIYNHILTHKYFINQSKHEEISMQEAITSWFTTVYMPVITAIEKHKMMRFPQKRTVSDLYVWIIKFYDDLKKKYGEEIPLEEAIDGVSKEYNLPLIKKVVNRVKKILIKHSL